MPAAPHTRDRLLAVGEALFAEHGYAGVSLRQITAAAQANVAALNYHFYDKEGLYRELIRLRLNAINAHRCTLLEAAEHRTNRDIVPLPDILDAFARPVLNPAADMSRNAPRLLGRVLSDPLPLLSDTLRDHFHPTVARFGQAVRRHVPALPASDFVWRWSFVVGALHHAMATLPDMGQHSRGLCRPDDREGALRNFVQMGVKALSA